MQSAAEQAPHPPGGPRRRPDESPGILATHGDPGRTEEWRVYDVSSGAQNGHAGVKEKNMKKKRSSRKAQAAEYIDDRSYLLKEAVAPGGALSPVHPHQLLRIGNPPPSRSMPGEPVTATVSHHVIKQDSVPSKMQLQKSDAYPGMWMLPAGVSLAPGLAVQTAPLEQVALGSAS